MMTTGRAASTRPSIWGSTPGRACGSRIVGVALVALAVGCADGRAQAYPERSPAPPPSGQAPATRHAPSAPAETCVGVADTGIWSDLDAQLQLAQPPGLTADRVSATLDADRKLLIVAVDGWPTKPYPLGGDATLTVGSHELRLRAGDRAELAPLLSADRLTTGRATADRDRDGVPDPLDVLLGARKTAINADAYIGGYESLRFPMGDVGRDHGVCTDVVIRALRNAGLDLQAAVHADIRKSPRSYPMVKGKGDPNIDHRRVKTLLPYLRRNLDERTAALDDASDPVRPGDVVLFDTFPSRSGPDHIGIVSDRRGDSGQLLVINNWTDGSVTGEMDLLAWLPVTHRFRVLPKR